MEQSDEVKLQALMQEFEAFKLIGQLMQFSAPMFESYINYCEGNLNDELRAIVESDEFKKHFVLTLQVTLEQITNIFAFLNNISVILEKDFMPMIVDIESGDSIEIVALDAHDQLDKLIEKNKATEQ